MLQTNPDGTNVVTPWLATGSTWNTDYTTLTFTIRGGVDVERRQPFSANDVVYTFNALKADAGARSQRALEADGGPLTKRRRSRAPTRSSSRSRPGADVLLLRRGPDADRSAAHLVSAGPGEARRLAPTPAPVGTGPYLMSNCSQNNIKYLRNPNYWQSAPGHPGAPDRRARLPGVPEQHSANLQLAQGQAQWGAQYIPNIDSYYVAKDPANRHYWFPPTVNVGVFPNLDNPLLGQLPVRQAISLAHRSRRGLAARRVRLPAAREPDRHRAADLPGLVRQDARHHRVQRLQGRPDICRPRASPRAPTASTRTPRASGSPSRSRRSVATRTGTPR